MMRETPRHERVLNTLSLPLSHASILLAAALPAMATEAAGNGSNAGPTAVRQSNDRQQVTLQGLTNLVCHIEAREQLWEAKFEEARIEQRVALGKAVAERLRRINATASSEAGTNALPQTELSTVTAPHIYTLGTNISDLSAYASAIKASKSRAAELEAQWKSFDPSPTVSAPTNEVYRQRKLLVTWIESNVSGEDSKTNRDVPLRKLAASAAGLPSVLDVITPESVLALPPCSAADPLAEVFNAYDQGRLARLKAVLLYDRLQMLSQDLPFLARFIGRLPFDHPTVTVPLTEDKLELILFEDALPMIRDGSDIPRFLKSPLGRNYGAELRRDLFQDKFLEAQRDTKLVSMFLGRPISQITEQDVQELYRKFIAVGLLLPLQAETKVFAARQRYVEAQILKEWNDELSGAERVLTQAAERVRRGRK